MFFRQTWTLTAKNLTIVLSRHWLSTGVRAFLAPIIFMFFISYAKNLFLPPSSFGIGSPTPLRSLSDAVAASAGGRNTFAFIDNGLTGGDISTVISQVSQPISAQGKTVNLLGSDSELLTTCRSSIRGVSPCFAAVTFHSSSTEGPGGFWNYTIRADGSFGGRIYVDSTSNDAEIYVLPLQHAIDSAIASLNTTILPSAIDEYTYTSQTSAERMRNITRLYMGSLISILAVAYFVGIVGICYQLTGQMAQERELGMSQLIESMMPNKHRWQPQAARILSNHVSFDILYFPSWIIMSLIVGGLNYPASGRGIIVGYFIMAGLSLSSWSIAFAALFRKAQLSGITVTIVSIVLAIIVQVVPPSSTGTAAVLSLLFPPMNYTLFIIYMAYWEQQNLSADLSKGPPTAPWQLQGYVFFIFLAIQILLYPVIGAFIERTLYGTSSKARSMHYGSNQLPETVKVSALSKYYPPNWWHRRIWSRFVKIPKETVRAVDNVDFTVLRGQISVLLGANGSGKSTTLDMLAGLQAPTSGTIDIDGRGGIGLCPQKNVLWDELTVYEHVKIFNRLKASTLDTKQQMQDLVVSVDLDEKLNARSETLSGGQKRKVQMAMMLTGGSSLCCLDEVSSGLDPLSRRKIWDILLAERGKRSILLTTHFLDEADLLSDNITILSKGMLVANGSAVELKHRLGGGYRVRVYHENLTTLPAELEATPKKVYYDHDMYQLADSAGAARFIALLEHAGVKEYQVNGPTVEDVFLKLSQEVQEELNNDRGSTPSPPSSLDIAARPEKEEGLQLIKGRNLAFIKQTWVLFGKRALILRHNYLPSLAALLIPIIAAGLVTLFLVGFTALSCLPQDQVSTSALQSALTSFGSFGAQIPVGPPGRVPIDLLNALQPGLGQPFRSVSTLDEFNNYITTNYSTAVPGGFFIGSGATKTTFAYRGNYALTFAIITQNLLDTSLLGFPITTAFQAFDVPWAPSSGKSLQLILYFGLAMSAYPGFFAIYPTVERLAKVRALHYSNGVRAGPLWLAYILFDSLIVLLVSTVCIIIFTAVSNVWYGPGYLFLVFFLYGISATLMSYVVSLFTTSQLAAFAFAAGGQCVFFLVYFVAYMVLITYSPVANVDHNVLIAHFTIALFFPAGNLLRALLLTFNEFSLLCQGTTSIAPYPGGILVYGGPILYLILQIAVLLTALVWYDSGWTPAFLARTRYRQPDAEEIDEIDPGVMAESERVDTSKDELRVLHATKAFGTNVAVQNVSFGVPRGEVFALLGPNGAGKSTTISLIRGDSRPSDKNSEILVENTSILSHRALARTHLGVCPQFDAMDQMTAIEHLRFYARARGVPDVEHNVNQVLHAVGLGAYKNRMAAKLSGGNKRKLSLGIALMGNPSVLLLDEPSSGMDAASKRIMWRTLSSVSSGRSLVLTTHSMEEADALADRAGIMARRMLALGTSDALRKKHGDAYHVHLVHRDAPYTEEADMNVIKSFIRDTFPGAVTEDRVFHGQLRFSVPNSGRGTGANNADGSSGSDVDKEFLLTTANSESSGENGISALFQQLEANKEKLGFQYYSVSQATLDQVFLSIVTEHNVQEENYARAHPSKIGMFGKVKKGFLTAYHDA